MGENRFKALHSGVAFAAITLLCALVYANSLGGELVYDDKQWIPTLETLRDPWDLRSIFGTRFFGEHRPHDVLYRPLTTWTLALNYGINEALGLGPAHPTGYRLLNVLLHATVACTLFRFAIALGLSRVGALATGLLFAVHPMLSEAIAQSINRSELLAALFGLVFLLLHRKRRSAASAACLLLALWSKESAVAFLPVAIAMDLCLGDRVRWRTLALHVVVVGIWLASRAAVIGDTPMDVPFMSNPAASAASGVRVLTACKVQMLYLSKLLLPVGLSSDHSYNQIPLVTSLADPGFLAFVATVSVAAVVAWLTRRRWPLIPFAVLAYAMLFAPVSNLLFPIGTIMGERLAYCPALFFLLLIGRGVEELVARFRTYAVVAAGVVLLLCGVATIFRNRTWTDEDRFYSAMVRSSPESAFAHYGVGRTRYQAHGDYDQAVVHYRKAIEILPDYSSARHWLAIAYRLQENSPAALKTLWDLLEQHPDLGQSWHALGAILYEQGKLEKAIGAYENAIRLNPEREAAYSELIYVYLEAKQRDKAQAVSERLSRQKAHPAGRASHPPH